MPVVNQKLIERTTRYCDKENRIIAECCVWTSTLKKQLSLHRYSTHSLFYIHIMFYLFKSHWNIFAHNYSRVLLFLSKNIHPNFTGCRLDT